MWFFFGFRLPWVDWQGGWKTHVEQQKGDKKPSSLSGAGKEHFETNNTPPPISLISSFLSLNVCYSGKSAAVVFCWKGMQVGARRQLSTYTYFCPLVIWIRFRYHFHLWTKKAPERKKALEKWCFMQGDVAHENYITTTPKSIFNLLMQINVSRWPRPWRNWR